MSVQIGRPHPMAARPQAPTRDPIEAVLRRRVIAQLDAETKRRAVVRRYPRAVRAFEEYCTTDNLEEAARRLGVSPSTVKHHVATVLRALDAISARQAAFRLWGPAAEART